jgi:hypothetical protein
MVERPMVQLFTPLLSAVRRPVMFLQCRMEVRVFMEMRVFMSGRRRVRHSSCIMILRILRRQNGRNGNMAGGITGHGMAVWAGGGSPAVIGGGTTSRFTPTPLTSPRLTTRSRPMTRATTAIGIIARIRPVIIRMCRIATGRGSRCLRRRRPVTRALTTSRVHPRVIEVMSKDLRPVTRVSRDRRQGTKENRGLRRATKVSRDRRRATRTRGRRPDIIRGRLRAMIKVHPRATTMVHPRVTSRGRLPTSRVIQQRAGIIR